MVGSVGENFQTEYKSEVILYIDDQIGIRRFFFFSNLKMDLTVSII